MGNIRVSDFNRVSSSGGNRDVLLDANRTALRKGSFWRVSLRQSSKQENVEVMDAFRSALRNEYGVFGEQAFDHVLSARSSLRKSLRTSDVRQAVSEATGTARFVSLFSEGARQMAIHPKFARKNLSVQEREDIGQAYRHLLSNFVEGRPLPVSLQGLGGDVTAMRRTVDEAKSVEELSPLAERFLEAAIEMVETGTGWEHEFTGSGGPSGLRVGHAPGLGKMRGLSMEGHETSVEDRVRAGTAGRGLSLNPRSLNPYVLDALKDKGVEPGFVAHHDWSSADTRSYMSEVDENSLRQEVYAARRGPDDPAMAPDDFMTSGEELRQAAMSLGETSGACMALLAENTIARALADTHHELHEAMMTCLDKAARSTERGGDERLTELGTATERTKELLIAHFMGREANEAIMMDEEALRDLARNMKLEAFSSVRRAIMSGTGGVNADHASVRRFQERVIVKLDYNQSDRTSAHGWLRKPLRCTQKQGYLYRGFCLHTVGGTNASAVGEVLANDLTRLTGVATQELSLVRGQYKNGATKLMLEGKMAQGYKDFDTCLLDGRLVMPQNGQVRDLGSYKAGFVLMGDRDSIGSKGQNKGFIGNQFFAIDPGHSLENSDIGLNEDFSLKGSSAKTFKNFSVFDDTTRADKFHGILRIREMNVTQTDVTLFNQYENQFSQESDKGLRNNAQKRIAEMKSEFTRRKNDILRTFEHQLNTYDACVAKFGSKGVADQAIEMEANLSKILSTTTMTSAHGEVDLRHLEVCHDGHDMQFRGDVSSDGDEIVYRSLGTLKGDELDEAMATLRAYGQGTGAGVRTTEDGHLEVVVRLDNHADVEARFKAFDESAVMKQKHLPEITGRMCANLSKLTSDTAMDGLGRHLVVQDGAGRHDWSVQSLGDGLYEFSCPTAGDASSVRDSIHDYLQARGLDDMQFGESPDGTLHLTLTADETMSLYGQLDENAIISHKEQ